MRCIIAGSRGATKYLVQKAILMCPFRNEITCVISGGARGADTYGEEFAQLVNLPVQRFLPDWDTHGKAAGILRNRQMADNAEALIAIWDGASKGTKNMMDEAVKRGLKVWVFSYKTLSEQELNQQYAS